MPSAVRPSSILSQRRPGASNRCALALQVPVGALLEFESVALPDTHRVQHAGPEGDLSP